MTKTKHDYILGFIGDRESKRKQVKIIRIPKDECPYCGNNKDVIKNGFDYQFRGTSREKLIPKYICKNCNHGFRERKYISAAHLMARQAAILWLQGWEYQAIAKRLDIAEITAQKYVLSLLKYKKAILVRKTAAEESPRTKSHTKLEIPLIKMWKEPKEDK